jgi:hypothetical protein
MEFSKEHPERMEPEVENCIDQLLQLEKISLGINSSFRRELGFLCNFL